MIMQFENNMSNFTLDMRQLKDTISGLRKMIPTQGEKIMQIETRHDEIIRALRELGKVMQERQLGQGL